MDFNALIKDFARLDQINKDLADLEKPEVIKAKAEKLMPKAKEEAILYNFNKELEKLLKDLL